VLPVHNVPVVHVGLDLSADIDAGALADAILAGAARMDLDPGGRLAIAFTWRGDPEYSRLRAVGTAIVEALTREALTRQALTRAAPAPDPDQLLLLMIDGDVGKSLGALIDRELGLARRIVAIDGVQLQELDYVDVGQMISPPGVVPVVIKSLLFS
jgi:ethanolamine utilization protein EutA